MLSMFAPDSRLSVLAGAAQKAWVKNVITPMQQIRSLRRIPWELYNFLFSSCRDTRFQYTNRVKRHGPCLRFV